MKNTTIPTIVAATVMAGYNTEAAQAKPKFTPEAEMAEGIIMVVSPAPCSEIAGAVEVVFKAPGFGSVRVFAFNAAADGRKGEYVDIAKNVPVDENGKGTFPFDPAAFPRGPVALTITGTREVDGKEVRDNNYYQLYNTVGIEGVHGMPSEPPPAAKGMRLVFADNFDTPLSIGKGPDFKYYDHKPPDGSQDFSQWENAETGCRGYRFTSFDRTNNPFARVDNFLRIRASTEAASTGIISSMQGDGSGFKMKAPVYFECRFIAPNAIGTWPAFWLLQDEGGSDELDIIEAYGGEGPSAPNFGHGYMICPHAWNQGEAGKALEREASKTVRNPQRMKDKGVSSNWYESFHTYAVLITEEDTIYYCDDIEMARHKTFPSSWNYPHYFLVNFAIGGISGWRIDLSRVHGVADMFVDYIRVYAGER